MFCIFNLRPKGKAKCFAGDVGSIGIAFIMLFALGRLIVQTGDITYLRDFNHIKRKTEKTILRVNGQLIVKNYVTQKTRIDYFIQMTLI